MPNGMANMIQMLATLSGIQSTKRAQALAEQQFEEQKSEFGRKMGYDEKSQEYKKVSDLIDRIATSSTESRQGLYDLGRSIGLNGDELNALMTYGHAAPESLDMLKTKAANAGVAAASPNVAAPCSSAHLRVLRAPAEGWNSSSQSSSSAPRPSRRS